MSKNFIKSSLEDIKSLNNLEKEKLNHYINIVITDVKKLKGNLITLLLIFI